MKPTLLLTAWILAFALSVTAQDKKTPLSKNKYRINLPDYWGHGNKVWEILTEKLPLVSEELKGKDICGDNCRPKYTVDFYITEPEVVGYSRYKKPQAPPAPTNTRLLATNTMPGLSLADPAYRYNMPTQYYNSPANNVQTEKWEIAGEYFFQCFLLLKDDTGHIITKFILVDTNELWTSPFKGDARSLYPSGNPDIFFEKNRDKFTPDKFELLGIVDKKLLSL